MEVSAQAEAPATPAVFKQVFPSEVLCHLWDTVLRTREPLSHSWIGGSSQNLILVFLLFHAGKSHFSLSCFGPAQPEPGVP